MKKQELDYEPEWCEDCSRDAEKEGFEYEFNWYVEDGQAICEHCGLPL